MASKGTLLSDQTAAQVTRPLVAVSIFFMIFSTFIVGLKTFSRHRLAKLPFWWDDFWILPAYVLVMCQASVAIAMCHVEIATDNENRIVTDPRELMTVLKMNYAELQLTLPSFACSRFSILCLYLRIFTGRGVRRTIWAICAFVITQWVAYAMAAFAVCRPLAFFWDKSLPGGGTCFAIDPFFRSITIPNIVVDFAIIVLPLPAVWRLHGASRLRKWGLTLLFGLGGLALGASAVRLHIFLTHTATVNSPSQTAALTMWLVVEPSIYLLAVCLPGMHHLFAALAPRVLGDWAAAAGGDRMAPRAGAAVGVVASRRTVDDDDDAKLVKRPRFGGDANFCRLYDGDAEIGYDMTVQGDSHDATKHGNLISQSAGGRNGGSVEAFELNGTGGGGTMSGSEPGANAIKGIVVTKEVIVTQEERIARIIGF